MDTAEEPKLDPYVDRIGSVSVMLFLVTGESKAEVAKRAFADEPSRSTPGSLLRAEYGSTTAVLDAAAASLL